MNEKFIPLSDVVDMFGITLSHAYHLRSDGHEFWRGKGFKLGKAVLYRESDITEYINQKINEAQ